MKKILVALALALFATSSFAIVENSKHDFNFSSTYSVNKASRCVYCHVPHNAQTWANTALWATPAASGGTFQFYSAGDTIDVARSQTCLACHADGTTATTGLAAQVLASANVGFDLRNDHPIGGMTVMTPGSGGMKPAPLVIGRTTVTAGVTTVQCATCHSVHGLSSYTIQGRKLLYGGQAGVGNSGNAAGWPNSLDFCNICHTR